MQFDRNHWLRKYKQRNVVNDLECVLGWANNKNVIVKFTNIKGGCFYPGYDVVELNVNLRIEKQLYFLLHELGHYLFDVNNKPTVDYYSHDWSLHNRVLRIKEEIAATERGGRLAKRLGLKTFDEKSYERLCSRGIYSHIKFTTRKRLVRRPPS